METKEGLQTDKNCLCGMTPGETCTGFHIFSRWETQARFEKAMGICTESEPSGNLGGTEMIKHGKEKYTT